MSIKKCLILTLIVMLAGLMSVSVHATKHGVKRVKSKSTSDVQEVVPESDETGKKRRKIDSKSEVILEEEDLIVVEEQKCTSLLSEENDVEDQLSSDETDLSEGEQSNPEVSVDELTPNGREIVRSLHSGFGLNLDILERPSAGTFKERLQNVYELVKHEPAVCVAPKGNALIIDSLHGNIARTRESILAARILLEEGEASSVIFMGNCADKGDNCVETLNEIFKFKLEFPKSVFLIGGEFEAMGVKSLVERRKVDFLSDVQRKFSKEDSDVIIKQIVGDLFKSLPIAVEVMLPTDKKVLCFYGNLPRIGFPGINEVRLYVRVTSFLRALKNLNLKYFYTWENKPAMSCVLGLNNTKMGKDDIELFLRFTGYKYLVKSGENLEDNAVDKFEGKCWLLKNNIYTITKEGVRPLIENMGGGARSLKEWNIFELEDFVRSLGDSNPDVLLGLGILAKNGGHFDSARDYFEYAVEAGSDIALYELGKCYEMGKGGVTQNYETAVKLYLASAKQGVANALYALGICYGEGKGTAKNIGRSVYYFKQAAEHGFVAAYYVLGNCYAMGCGVPRDVIQMIECYRRAAEQNEACAQCELGHIYMKGQGVKKDDAKAFKWFSLSADKGNAIAQVYTGLFYKEGWGNVTVDVSKAVSYFDLAAGQSDAKAHFLLGVCYERYFNNRIHAFKNYQKAAKQGVVDAQRAVGKYCIDGGGGVKRDYCKAVKFFKMAAEQGDMISQFELGRCYETGCGVYQDYNEAVKWYSMAAYRGYQKAIFRLKALGHF